jgi:hypothetical protein
MILPPFVSPGPLWTAVFLAVVALVFALGITGVFVANRRLGHDAIRRSVWVAVGWMALVALTSAIVASGAMATTPILMMALFGLINITALATGLSPLGGWLARGLPTAALVGFQGFRLPLEVVLHGFAEAGTIPVEMTWNGSNIDVIAGGIALLAAPFSHHRAVAWTANIVGIVLLANVIRVVMLSSPLPWSWWEPDPPLMLAFHLPYMWIAPVCVAAAITGHIVLTRHLIGSPRS